MPSRLQSLQTGPVYRAIRYAATPGRWDATGTIGPDLDKLVSYAQHAKQPLDAFVERSIVDPNTYVESGYAKGVMPETFGQSLSKSQLDALVTFLVQSAQKKKG